MKAVSGPFLALFLPFLAGAEPISLFADRKVFLAGEPVYLRMESHSGRPPALEAGLTILAVTPPDSSEFLYQPPMRYRIRQGEPSAGEPQVRFARLIAHREGLLFRKAGRYRLRLVSPVALKSPGASSSPGSRLSVLSDTLELIVAEPATPSDKRAYAMLGRNTGQYALAVYLEGGGHLKGGMSIIRELAGFPNYLQRTAAFVLSSDWSQDYTPVDGGPVRSLDLTKALALAQWDLKQGAYIPLRNAFRIRQGAEILSRRAPDAPVLEAARNRLGKFEASLSARDMVWYGSL